MMRIVSLLSLVLATSLPGLHSSHLESDDVSDSALGLIQSRTTGNWLEGRCRANSCHADAECIETTLMGNRRSHRCRCRPGFYGNGKVCIDDDECEQKNGGCTHRCLNTVGSFVCSCHSGFQLHSDQRNCNDINECSSLEPRHPGVGRDVTSRCSYRCENTLGGYVCWCPSGQILATDGRSCVAVSRCHDHHGCAQLCQNRATGGHCACRTGYRLHPNGKDCVASCSHGNGGCHHLCTETPASVTCTCRSDYLLAEDGRSCAATCGVQNGGCQHVCRDTLEGPHCSCNDGFALNPDEPKTCLDIDECAINNGDCSDGCQNTVGDHECTCPDGYRIDTINGTTCIDVNECSWPGSCDHICINTEGSFTCQCHHGYQLYGVAHCADINECSINNGGCQEACVNTVGSYHCQCNTVLHANGRDCNPALLGGPCRTLRAPPHTTLTCHTSSLASKSCRVQCSARSAPVSASASGGDSSTASYVTTCSPATNFRWTHDTPTADGTLLGCSDLIVAPSVDSTVKFSFITKRCSRSRTKHLLSLEKQIGSVLHICGVPSQNSTGMVDQRGCVSRSAVQNVTCRPAPPQYRQLYRAATSTVKQRRQSLQKLSLVSVEFQIQVHALQGVGCPESTYYDQRTGTCLTCPPGQYQPDQGRMSCISRHGSRLGNHRPTAECPTNDVTCNDLCMPGTYSYDGFRPCKPCPSGTYQPDFGRISCLPCGITDVTDDHHFPAISFRQCLSVSDEICNAGHYYSRFEESCQPCPVDSYQEQPGLDYCVDCPQGTHTDGLASVSPAQCKSRQCFQAAQFDRNPDGTASSRGFLQSPNWPGEYPGGVDCTWTVGRAASGVDADLTQRRRLLVVVTEVSLGDVGQSSSRSSGSCDGDALRITEQRNPAQSSGQRSNTRRPLAATVLFNACRSIDAPIAFTSRPGKVNVSFHTDNVAHGKGFSLGYVTYSEEFHDLITDIIGDKSLYSSHQHRQLLRVGCFIAFLQLLYQS